jgi:hypothetical protein
LSDYLDGSLAPAERAAVEEHLKECSRCGDALDELKKTVEHIRTIEPVEPPAWMTRKIMATVREEQGKKGFLRRLFFPLHVKLPIEALGVVLLAFTAFFIYRDMGPAGRYEQAAPAFDKALSQTGPEEHAKDRERAEPKVAPRKPENRVLDMKEEYKAPPPLPGKTAPAPYAEAAKPAEQEGFAENRSPQAASGADEAVQDRQSARALAPSKTKQETPPPSAKGFAPLPGDAPAASPPRSEPELYDLFTQKKASPVEPRMGPRIAITVRNIPEAFARIEKSLKELGGTLVRKETSPGRVDLTVQAAPDRKRQLIDFLKTLGKVETTDGMQGEIITIRLIEAGR